MSATQVSLGPLYLPEMWDLRKEVSKKRSLGSALIFVDIRAPINSDVVHLALRSDDLYLIGIKGKSGPWYEFEPDLARSHPKSGGVANSLLPNSKWIKAGSKNALSTYTALHLLKLIENSNPLHYTNKYSGTPLELIRFFSVWDGNIRDDFTRLRICVLIFSICESLRFRSIESTACNWVSPSSRMPDGHWPTFEITAEMLKLARTWHEKARTGHPDVQTWPAGMPDLLIH